MFTSLGTPMVLFEPGHYPMDYDRDTTLISLRGLSEGLKAICKEDYIHLNADEYQQIPENSKDYVDIIIHGVKISDAGETLSNQSLELIIEEVLDNNRILFQPKCLVYGKNLDLIRHQTFLISDLNIPDLIEFKTGKFIEIF